MRSVFSLAPIFWLAATLFAQDHVSFPTEDGGVVFADLYGKGDRGVVLAHGGRFTKESWAPQAKQLVGAGFHVIAFDFRGYGQSHGGPGTPGDEGVRFDVLAAVKYLREHGAAHIYIVGASFGGSAASEAVAASKPGEIERLVLLGTYAEQPEKVTGRKLLIVARDDSSGDGPRLPGIQKSYDKLPEPKQLIIVEGDAHAQFLFATDQGDRVMREILQFLTAP